MPDRAGAECEIPGGAILGLFRPSSSIDGSLASRSADDDRLPGRVGHTEISAVYDVSEFPAANLDPPSVLEAAACVEALRAAISGAWKKACSVASEAANDRIFRFLSCEEHIALIEHSGGKPAVDAIQ